MLLRKLTGVQPVRVIKEIYCLQEEVPFSALHSLRHATPRPTPVIAVNRTSYLQKMRQNDSILNTKFIQPVDTSKIYQLGIAVFRDVTLCNLVERYQHFERRFCVNPHIPEDRHLPIHCYEDLKSHTVNSFYVTTQDIMQIEYYKDIKSVDL